MKRAFLLAEQVVKIVVALIVLSFLIYFLSSLYFSKIETENQQKAEGFVSGQDSLETTIKSLNPDESRPYFNPSPPEGWYLFSFVNDSKPTACEKEKCLCICNKVVFNFGERQINECNEKGACLKVSNLIEEEIQIKLQKEKNLTISNIDGKIKITGE